MKKNEFSKLVVSAVILINLAFAAGCLYVFLRTGNEPSTLITAVFSFTTVELWSLAGIKKSKIKNDKGDINNDKY